MREKKEEKKKMKNVYEVEKNYKAETLKNNKGEKKKEAGVKAH